MTEQPQPRTSQQGDPCPPWCVTDHSLKFFSSAHVGRPYGAGPAWASAVRSYDGLTVAINGIKDGASARLTLSVHDAEQMAVLLDMAGDAGQLAAAIRQAAADITTESGEAR
jgi:hypothetical protein